MIDCPLFQLNVSSSREASRLWKEELIDGSGQKAFIETHSLAERVVGTTDADLRAERGLFIFITELYAFTVV